MTNTRLWRQNFCLNKNDTCGCSHQWYASSIQIHQFASSTWFLLHHGSLLAVFQCACGISPQRCCYAHRTDWKSPIRSIVATSWRWMICAPKRSFPRQAITPLHNRASDSDIRASDYDIRASDCDIRANDCDSHSHNSSVQLSQWLWH